MIKVEINGDPLGIREARGGLPAAVTGYGREQVRDLAHLTDRLIDGQGGEIDSFLLGIGHTFYHAGAAPASLQTSITQSRRWWYIHGRLLTRRPAEHIAQDHHRPLPRRQMLDRGQERQFDRLLRDEGGVRLG